MRIPLPRYVFVQLALILSVLTLAGCQSVVERCTEPTTRLSGGMLWNGDGFERRDVEINAGVFIRPGSCGAVQANIDLADKWVTPAFGDTHSHRLESGFMYTRFSEQFVREGIYYVFNPNADNRLMAGIFDRSASVDTVEVATTFGGITSTFGHPQGGLSLVVAQFLYPGQSRDDMDGHVFHSVDSDDDIEPVLDTLLEQGASSVKLYLHDSEHFDKKRSAVTAQSVAQGLDYSQTEFLFGLNPELVPSIVSAAKQRNLRVIAHIHSLVDLRLAVAAGVDHLAHLPGAYVTQETQLANRKLSAEDAAAIAKGNISVTASYSARPDITPPELRPALIELQASNIRLLHDAGVAVYLGADRYDQTAAFEYNYWLEHGLLAESEVLKQWIESGQFVFPQRKIGRLAPEYEASFLVFDRNPAVDGNALTRLQQRYKEGVLLAVTEQQSSDDR